MLSFTLQCGLKVLQLHFSDEFRLKDKSRSMSQYPSDASGHPFYRIKLEIVLSKIRKALGEKSGFYLRALCASFYALEVTYEQADSEIFEMHFSVCAG